jgi:hypothetical protein
MCRLCEFQFCYNNLAHFSLLKTKNPADTMRLADTFQVFRQEFKGLFSKNIFKFCTINSTFAYKFQIRFTTPILVLLTTGIYN